MRVKLATGSCPEQHIKARSKVTKKAKLTPIWRVGVPKCAVHVCANYASTELCRPCWCGVRGTPCDLWLLPRTLHWPCRGILVRWRTWRIGLCGGGFPPPIQEVVWCNVVDVMVFVVCGHPVGFWWSVKISWRMGLVGVFCFRPSYIKCTLWTWLNGSGWVSFTLWMSFTRSFVLSCILRATVLCGITNSHAYYFGVR